MALALLSLVFGLLIIFMFWFNPYRNSLGFRRMPNSLSGATPITIEQAEADLAELYGLLRRIHPALIKGVPEETERAYAKATAELTESSRLTVDSLRRGAQAVLSTLGDAHTGAALVGINNHYLPDYGLMRNQGFVISAIDGVSLDDLFLKNRHLYSYEAESWGRAMLHSDIISLEGLRYLGYEPRGSIEITFTNEEEQVLHTYALSEFLDYESYLAVNGTNQALNAPFVSYEINQDRDYALLTLRSCIYNAQYRETLKEMFSAVQAQGITRVIVDLRDNSGGNSFVANHFIRYLDVEKYQEGYSLWRLGPIYLKMGGKNTNNNRFQDLLFTGDVFVLTSTQSFSSATMFSWYIQDNGLGLVVGEVPGNAANGYGDITGFRLKNSGIIVCISYKQFFRADTSAGDYVIPNLQCSADQALEVALEQMR